MTSSITEKAVSTDEENAGKKTEESKPEMDSSNDDLPPDAKKVLSSVSYDSLYSPFNKALFRQPPCNVTHFPAKSHSLTPHRQRHLSMCSVRMCGPKKHEDSIFFIFKKITLGFEVI